MDSVTRYLELIDVHPELTADEKRELPGLIRSGCEISRQRYIAANLKLVVHIVSRHLGSLRHPKTLDYIQVGNLGLMDAIDRYDPERSAFSTYATWWIRQRIQVEDRKNSRTIRLSSTVYNHLGRLRKACLENPFCARAAEEYDTYYKSLPQTISLNAPHCANDDDNSFSIGDSISCNIDHPSSNMSRIEEAEALRKAMDVLSSRERQVLECRFGLNETEAQTFEDIGRELAITRERVRQIHKSAVLKLKAALQTLR